MICKVKDVYKVGDLTTISFTTHDDVGELSDRLYEVDIKEASKKRSLDSNAYAWVLIDKLAAKLRMKPKEVYKEAIRNTGGVSKLVCVTNDAVEDFIRVWESNGLGFQSESMPSKLPGCTTLMLWYGSSVFTQEQMNTLIETLTTECKEQGISCLTPLEVQALEEHIARR